MSVAVSRSPTSVFESILMLSNRDKETTTASSAAAAAKQQEPPRVDLWSSIQANKTKQEEAPKPYVHPLARRSSGLLSQKSLAICTESLGSESGSFDESDLFFTPSFSASSTVHKVKEDGAGEKYEEERRAKELGVVNHRCCASSRRVSPPRSFPPPLPSISRRDGPCLQMRPHRRDGRLVLEAVPVPSQNYLHAERQNGRLLLSFIKPVTTSTAASNYSSFSYNASNNNRSTSKTQADEEAEIEEEEEEEEEEEVEVVERRTVVEVKVSTQQPQQQSGGSARVHRSSLVINKFVSCAPEAAEIPRKTEESAPTLRRAQSMTTTTAAAAAVAASSASTHCHSSEETAATRTDHKVLFTSKRRNREELLHDMRRCSQLRKPLFIWEPCCIVTSSS